MQGWAAVRNIGPQKYNIREITQEFAQHHMWKWCGAKLSKSSLRWGITDQM